MNLNKQIIWYQVTSRKGKIHFEIFHKTPLVGSKAACVIKAGLVSADQTTSAAPLLFLLDFSPSAVYRPFYPDRWRWSGSISQKVDHTSRRLDISPPPGFSVGECVYVCVSVYICVCACFSRGRSMAHSYTYTHIPTHIHTYTHTQLLSGVTVNLQQTVDSLLLSFQR